MRAVIVLSTVLLVLHPWGSTSFHSRPINRHHYYVINARRLQAPSNILCGHTQIRLKPKHPSTSVHSEKITTVCQGENVTAAEHPRIKENAETNPLHHFTISLQSLTGIPPATQSILLEKVQQMGFQSSKELSTFAADFISTNQPDKLSSVFINDFGLNPLHANYIRAALVQMSQNANAEKKEAKKIEDKNIDLRRNSSLLSENSKTGANEKNTETKRVAYKSIVVNEKARQRQQKVKRTKLSSPTSTSKTSITKNTTKLKSNGKVVKNDPTEYGLQRDYASYYPKLASEIDDFYHFMTTPMAVLTQEPPIRKATADIYLKHAKLFLGWYLHELKTNPDMQPQQQSQILRHENPSKNTSKHSNQNISLFDIIPNKDKSSASIILHFILFLRNERQISVSYEANLLRGIMKLMKFRFSQESKSDPSYGGNSFEDIPLVNELRKLHREANKKQGVSPRVSEEGKKWLEWEEYLEVVIKSKDHVMDLINNYFEQFSDIDKVNTKQLKMKEQFAKRVANFYQHYLVLAFFSCVPDRQRTIRELELQKTFYKGEDNIYVIKHGPDDYKTGKAYGDRPPLTLASELTNSIDDFITNWRPYLSPKSQHLFIQPRTGNPLTSDSVYQIVSRACYKYAGKRTNPHLLRDMIVTHIRQSSNASEKQLEALALYMGHSIAMQRSSYDRRTMGQKIAPAIELLQNVNRKKDSI